MVLIALASGKEMQDQSVKKNLKQDLLEKHLDIYHDSALRRPMAIRRLSVRDILCIADFLSLGQN